MAEYTKEQLQKLYEKLPKELQEAIFSAETADHIRLICSRAGLKEENNPKIAELVGDVLLGILPSQELTAAIQNKLGLSEDSAKKISEMADTFIFQPVKPFLNELYKEKTKEPAAKEEKRTAVEDKYQESIE